MMDKKQQQKKKQLEHFEINCPAQIFLLLQLWYTARLAAGTESEH